MAKAMKSSSIGGKARLAIVHRGPNVTDPVGEAWFDSAPGIWVATYARDSMSEGDNKNEEKDIVEHLSEATGYFHDSEAAKLRDIAEASGQKPVGIVRAAVEDEIEDREWKVAHFEDDGREYIPHNPFEYYRIHKKLQKQFEAAISELSYEDGVYGEKPKEEFEIVCKRLRERARVHEAKADRAEQWLEENGEDPETVLMA